MLAEIITIGDEILIGQIVDTNSTYISKSLNKIGVQVKQITSIQDDQEHIIKAFKDAEKKVDIVIVTGGLGPTKDDITKQSFCRYLDDTLVEDEKVLIHVKALYKKYTNHPLLPESLNQALVPSSAKVLMNRHGTAPGMWMKKNNTVFISLPGVPYEMKQMMKEEVLPRIIKTYDCPYIYHKTLLTHGMGESEIIKRIHIWEDQLPSSIKLAYLPSFGRVRLRLSSKGKDKDLVQDAVNSEMKILKELLFDIAVGFEGETTIIQEIAKEFIDKEKTLSVAESCTGGAIAELITAQSGVSAFFHGALVAYATEIKSSILNLDQKIINKHSVVSIEVVEAMALQSNKLFATDYAIATTGIAGPSRGDVNEELGTVWIAIAGPKGVFSKKFNFGQPRERVIARATNKAFELLLKEFKKN